MIRRKFLLLGGTALAALPLAQLPGSAVATPAPAAAEKVRLRLWNIVPQDEDDYVEVNVKAGHHWVCGYTYYRGHVTIDHDLFEGAGPGFARKIEAAFRAKGDPHKADFTRDELAQLLRPGGVVRALVE